MFCVVLCTEKRRDLIFNMRFASVEIRQPVYFEDTCDGIQPFLHLEQNKQLTSTASGQEQSFINL